MACDQVIPTQPARAYRPLCAPWLADRSPWQDRYKSLDDPMCDPTYTLMSDTRTWAGADAACKAAGKQLATVRSAAQSALLLTAAAGNSVWIGGTDAASEGTWVWSPSNTPLSYTNWYSGQPDNHLGGEDCLMFNFPHGNGGKWNDANCQSALKYVCETTTCETTTLLNPLECDRTYSSVRHNAACGTGHAQSMLDSPQAWSADNNNAGQWMRIDAGSALLVYGVRAQARSDVNQKVTAFTVQHSTDDSAWSNVDGDATFTDASGEFDALFATPVMAQYIRITVVSWATHISMRAGLIRSPLPLQVAQPPSESTRPLHAFLTCASPAIGAAVRGVRQPKLLRWILPWRRGLQRDGMACRGRTERPCGSSSRKGYRSPPTHGPARSTTGTSALGVTWASTSRRRTRKGCAQPA